MLAGSSNGPNWWNIIPTVIAALAAAIGIGAFKFTSDTKVQIAELRIELREVRAQAAEHKQAQWKALSEFKIDIKDDLKLLAVKVDDIRDRIPPKYSQGQRLRSLPELEGDRIGGNPALR